MSQDTIVVDPAIMADPSVKAAADAMQTPAKVEEPAKPKAVEIKVEDEGVDAKYRGKTVAEIIEMHRNAESRLGAQGQELGVWRGLVTELGDKLKQTSHQPSNQETALQVTSDELLTDPVNSISKVVKRELEAALRPVQQRQDLSARESELAALNREYPTMNQIGDDPAFQQWAVATRGRKADAEAAARGDTNAARRLLEAWTDRQSLTTQTQRTDNSGKPQGTAGAKAVATEAGGGARGTTTGKVFNRQEVVDLIIKNPDLYNSDEYQRELLLAAKEGRIR